MYDKEIVPLPGLKAGYIIFRDNSHPLAYSEGAVYLHRHLASIREGRWLSSEEHVHHIDENKLNNSLNNLVVLSRKEHAELHNPSIESIVCPVCSSVFKPVNRQVKFCSQFCYKSTLVKNIEITKELLDDLIPKHSWVDLGSMFGYSDVGIKKRAKALGCSIPVRCKR